MCRYIVIVAVCLASLQALAAEEHLSVSELLDKYASTQDKLQSFITKSEETTVHTSVRTGLTIWKTVAEFRVDGDRVDYRSYRWRNLASEDEVTNNLEEAQYRSFLWDGSRHIHYRTGGTLSDNIAAVHRQAGPYKKRRSVAIEYGGAPLLGIFDGDEDRVDSVLRKADSISVRDELEQVGGAPCYVIDAKTKWGTYTVWIDPEHGYNITKADVQRKKGDLIWRDRTLTDNSSSFSLKNVRFEKINDVWIPMEADIGIIIKRPTYIQDIKVKHKRTEVILNPDHDALGSFVPDIENGTRVYIDEAPGITYTWQDGKLVPQIDEYVIDEIDKMTEEIMAEDQAPVRLEAKKTKAVPNDLTVAASTQPKTQVDAIKTQPEVVAESGSLPIVLVILISFLIIGLIAWMVFRRLKA